MKIIRYKKYIDRNITRTLSLPMDSAGMPIGTELATLVDGLTYCSLKGGAKLPRQAAEISSSIETVTLTAAQIAEIKKVSPHVKLINSRIHEKIREKWLLDDELKLARIAIGALNKTYTPSADELQSITNYQTDVEAIRDWGRAEKAKLGL